MSPARRVSVTRFLTLWHPVHLSSSVLAPNKLQVTATYSTRSIHHTINYHHREHDISYTITSKRRPDARMVP